MLKSDCKKTQAFARNAVPSKIVGQSGQAAAELAVFGAILIFILGAIVSAAVGNSYTQNEGFKAMRMAMLASWKGSQVGSTARNNASILFVEDRLSPDSSKYGDTDRTPYVSMGSGTFSYELLYPIDPAEVPAMLPIMDVYINGQHFPLTTANYLQNVTIPRPTKEQCDAYPAGSCAQNQCMRNYREWVGSSAGGVLYESELENIVPVTPNIQATTTAENNADAIFKELAREGVITNVIWNGISSYGTVSVPASTSAYSTWVNTFTTWYDKQFPGKDQSAQISKIENLLQSNQLQYKLFYTQMVNGMAQFTQTPPTCSSHPCKDKELSSDLVLTDAYGNPHSNSTGDMMYDLRRSGKYDLTDTSFVPYGGTPDLRPNMIWEWAATAGTTAEMIGLDVDNNQYPQYDIDGRLKTVTIYGISQNPDGTPNVTYEDFQAGDIDATWDANSCGPKPGLQSNTQVYTFTKDGTYLLIKEGGLFNPQTGQFVRSANKRDTIDIIQRQIQLSNNTGRFCDGNTPKSCVGGSMIKGIPYCSSADANPVEVCVGQGAVDAQGNAESCFSSQTNIKSTCYDGNSNILFIRSRIEDRRGHFWLTNTSGQLQVQ